MQDTRAILDSTSRLRLGDMSELRVELIGREARLAEVGASDVARLILSVEQAIRRSASVVLGRPKTTSGRYDESIAQALRLKLRSVEDGGVVPVLELPDLVSEDTLDFDVSGLGDTALGKLLDAADPRRKPHPVVARALLDVADKMHIGDRYDAVTFVSSANQRPPVRVDAGVRLNLREYVTSTPTPIRSDAVIGTLVETSPSSLRQRHRPRRQPCAPWKPPSSSATAWSSAWVIGSAALWASL